MPRVVFHPDDVPVFARLSQRILRLGHTTAESARSSECPLTDLDSTTPCRPRRRRGEPTSLGGPPLHWGRCGRHWCATSTSTPPDLRTPLNPWTYPWSSHAVYLGGAGPVTVQTSTVLESLHRQVGPALQAYRRLLKDGLAHGHQERFYETVDQRFLGDERFIEEADRRTAATREVAVRPQRVAFATLLAAVATAYEVTPQAILAPGRHRVLVPARATLVGLARRWSLLTTRELGRRLHRDPSMISRLAAAYAACPAMKIEAQIHRSIQPG